MSVKRIPKPGTETAAVLMGTTFSAILLVLTVMNAGPLWRDETNTFNLARMPLLEDIWHNLHFESCPLLWPMLVRGCGILGLTDGDMSIRILGLGIGLFFLTSLWLCQRCIGGGAPILSIALLGGLPAFLFVVGANRAYGLAGCLLVLSFGKIWRVVESPTKSRILSAGFICLLFTQCVYYDVIFLGAMLAAGALVAIRRQRWKIVWTMAGMGLLAGASLLIYLPIIHRIPEYLPFWRSPFFDAATLWNGLSDALAARSSANPDGANGPADLDLDRALVGGHHSRRRDATNAGTPNAEAGSCLEKCQRGAVRPGTVLCHQRGSGNHRVHWVPAEIAVFHAAMVLRRNPNPLRHFPRRHLECELAGAPSLGIDAHWLPGGDDDIKRGAGMGGSAHPPQQFRCGCRFSQPQRFSGRPHRGPGSMGGYYV